MIINPAVISLASCSLLVSITSVCASLLGIRIIRKWDMESGSREQLTLERLTYLISTILNYTMICELLSLFLFISMADQIHTLFIGAMCAAGTLNANIFGYAALIAKIINFISCGLWIIVNHVDNKGFDYPLIKFKYKLLLMITLMLILETVLLFNYLFRLEPEIITSCCGTIFNEDADSIAGELAHLPSLETKIAFYLSLILTLCSAAYFFITGKGTKIYAFLSITLFFISAASVISFISLYYYELPTHHCPFCLLQQEYHYIGYPLYLSLFIGAIMGSSVGTVDFFMNKASLREIIPKMQKRFCMVSIAAQIVFALIATYPILFSSFKLEGY